MAKKSVRQMAADLYDDPELLEAVLADVDRLKTADKIEAGELVLPHPVDAKHWHRRITGRGGMTDAQVAEAKRLEQLEKAVADMKQQLNQGNQSQFGKDDAADSETEDDNL